MLRRHASDARGSRLPSGGSGRQVIGLNGHWRPALGQSAPRHIAAVRFGPPEKPEPTTLDDHLPKNATHPFDPLQPSASLGSGHSIGRGNASRLPPSHTTGRLCHVSGDSAEYVIYINLLYRSDTVAPKVSTGASLPAASIPLSSQYASLRRQDSPDAIAGRVRLMED